MTALALAALIVAVVAGTPAAAQQPAAGDATSPVSSGPIDPHAIPLGDGYVSTSPKIGYVDSCTTSFGNGGAEADVPWIDTTAKTWDPSVKPAVQGSVDWPTAYFGTSTSGDRRIIRFNALPVDTPTGTFPIATDDPAYQYDHNPNHISAHTENWSLPLNPTAASTPNCANMGAIGVLTNGVELFNALDDGGRDAGAHEVQDSCGGHPEQDSVYHYHSISSCILDKVPDGTTQLVGYALDGYGIYVAKAADGTLPTNADLDACHGTTSAVDWNGSVQDVYHYVVTAEYPYTVGCFHGTPIHTGAGQSNGGQGKGSSGKAPACKARRRHGSKGHGKGGRQGGSGPNGQDGSGGGRPGQPGGQPGGDQQGGQPGGDQQGPLGGGQPGQPGGQPGQPGQPVPLGGPQQQSRRQNAPARPDGQGNGSGPNGQGGPGSGQQAAAGGKHGRHHGRGGCPGASRRKHGKGGNGGGGAGGGKGAQPGGGQPGQPGGQPGGGQPGQQGPSPTGGQGAAPTGPGDGQQGPQGGGPGSPPPDGSGPGGTGQ